MGRGTSAEISRKVSSHFCSPGRGVKQSSDCSGQGILQKQQQREIFREKKMGPAFI